MESLWLCPSAKVNLLENLMDFYNQLARFKQHQKEWIKAMHPIPSLETL